MFTGPKIETNGLKLHIDTSVLKNDNIRSIGRTIQSQNLTLNESKDLTKRVKTVNLSSDSLLTLINLVKFQIGVLL